MSFADDVRDVGSKMKEIMEISDLLTPDVITAMKRVGSIDWDNAALLVGSYDQMNKNKDDIRRVENGLYDIKKVASMENQVNAVRNNEQNIGLVAGNLKDINASVDAMENMAVIIRMKKRMQEIVGMKPVIKECLMMKGEIELTSKIAENFRDEIAKIEELQVQASNSAMLAIDMVNKMNITEKRIDEKLKRVEEISRTIQEFQVKVVSVGSREVAKSSYNPDANRLDLYIPEGKTGPRGNHKGDKGEPGKNGSNFVPSYMGSINEKGRYSNHAPGTSFLSLDEIPTMIYFRKSNALDDWTDGQPFGVSNGGYSDVDKGIDIVNGINIDELTSHILSNIKRREDG